MIYFPWGLTHVKADKQPRTRNTQEIAQGVNQNNGNFIENWLSTVPLSLESLVDPSLQTTLETMSLNSYPSGQIPQKNPKSATGIRAPQFRYLLGKRNIFINTTDPSPELVKRAKEIITNKALFPEMDDALAKELEGKAWQLETKPGEDLITELFTPLIPALERVPYQSLARSKNRMW